MDLETLNFTRSQLAKGGYIKNKFIFSNKIVKENKKLLEIPRIVKSFSVSPMNYEDVYNGNVSFTNGYNPPGLRTPAEEMLQNKRTSIKPSVMKKMDTENTLIKSNREK